MSIVSKTIIQILAVLIFSKALYLLTGVNEIENAIKRTVTILVYGQLAAVFIFLFVLTFFIDNNSKEGNDGNES